MRLIRWTFALTALALSGCATLNEAQCTDGDWFGIGANDARSGHTPDRIVQHRRACEKFAVMPEPQDYDAGYQVGLIDFCVSREGFLLGHRGASYYGQCPPDTEHDFIPAYELGLDLYAIDQDLQRIHSEISDLRKTIKDEKASDTERQSAGRQLDYVKEELQRRQYDRGVLVERARQRGYGSVW